MLSIRICILFFLGITIFSCKQAVQDNPIAVNTDTITSQQQNTFTFNNLSELFAAALKEDSLELNDYPALIYFKSGFFLNPQEKNIVCAEQIADTTYALKLYTIRENNWMLSDSIISPAIWSIHFQIYYNDYNFDAQTDIFIRTSASNGYVMERGILLIINPETHKMEIHNEALDLANMYPDPDTKTVISDEFSLCNKTMMDEVCKIENKWINGKLKAVKKTCPCEDE
jgi:hypothetical protein